MLVHVGVLSLPLCQGWEEKRGMQIQSCLLRELVWENVGNLS